MFYSFGGAVLSVDSSRIFADGFKLRWKEYETDGVNEQELKIILKVENSADDVSLLHGSLRSSFVSNKEGSGEFDFQVDYYEKHCCIVTLSEDSKACVDRALLYAVMIALSEQYVSIHAVSVLVNDKLVLLSAPSGTGKTTLSQILHDSCGAAVLNGDFALLSLGKNGEVFFEPTPFCGTSNICHNYRLTVDEIVFLRQSRENEWQSLTAVQAYTELLKNSFLPMDSDALGRYVNEHLLDIAERIPAYEYGFAPTPEAGKFFCESLEKL